MIGVQRLQLLSFLGTRAGGGAPTRLEAHTHGRGTSLLDSTHHTLAGMPRRVEVDVHVRVQVHVHGDGKVNVPI